jgi:hypothetical protein
VFPVTYDLNFRIFFRISVLKGLEIEAGHLGHPCSVKVLGITWEDNYTVDWLFIYRLFS